jgi:hypothetical protein
VVQRAIGMYRLWTSSLVRTSREGRDVDCAALEMTGALYRQAIVVSMGTIVRST